MAAVFIWWPLIAAVPFLHAEPAAGTAYGIHVQNYGQPQPNEFWAIKIGDVLTIFILFVQALIFLVQAYLAHRQRIAMDGQLKATQTAASAALASLDRPWLFVCDLKLNQAEWSNAEQPLVAELCIANYGKAPAFIKSLKIAHFRGPHHHNGYPIKPLPDGMKNFPAVSDLETFFARNARTVGREIIPLTEGEPIGMKVGARRFLTVGEDLTVPIGPGVKTGSFCAYGFKKVETFVGAINPITLTESYLIGRMFYEIPGQDSEIITFCYKYNGLGGFDLYRDYPPYNERKGARH
jgi:hypothetical protein